MGAFHTRSSFQDSSKGTFRALQGLVALPGKRVHCFSCVLELPSGSLARFVCEASVGMHHGIACEPCVVLWFGKCNKVLLWE